MHLHDLINPADLERGIADKLITVRESHDGQRIYNYSDAALWTAGAWDDPPPSVLAPRPCGCGEWHDPTLRHCADCERPLRNVWGGLCTDCAYQRETEREEEE